MEKSHELTQLEICHRRGIKLDKQATTRLHTLTKGYEGENIVYQWFKKYSKGQLNIITDYWFFHGKSMQVDLLVILNQRWIVIEVKNFYGKFEYRNHECYLRGKLMGDNYFTQLIHRTQRLQHIANELNPAIKVESVMVFIDEHCDVQITSDISTKVLQKHQLRAYVESLTNDSKYEQQLLSLDRVIKHLEKYRVVSPFQPLLLTDNKVEKELRRGVSCCECQSFNTKTSFKYVICQKCGKKEYKKAAIMRATLELRYIHYYHPTKITCRKIYEYCDKAISKSTIAQVLTTQFQVVNKGRSSFYRIPPLQKLII